MAPLLQKGTSLEQALGWFQVELSNVYADQLVQLLQVSLRSGGAGLVANLERLSEIIRVQGSLEEELAAKQGWVTGTAKLGLIAPWLIVLFLNARTEAHTFYVSAAGFALLSVGLVICLLAYLLIVAAGRLPKAKRVFIDVA
jgi:tight adherence protein B